MRRLAVLGLLSSGAVTFALLVATPASAGAQYPAAAGYVVDETRQVPAASVAVAIRELTAYADATGTQVAVAVVNSLGGKSVEDYTHDLFARWGVGQRGKDNGVLLLIAPNEHKDRIEVGRGLEGQLTDLQSGEILRNTVTPAAKAGDLGAAVVDGERAIRQAIGADPTGQPGAATGPDQGGTSAAPRTSSHFPIGALLVPLLILGVAFGGSRRGRRGGLGGFGTGMIIGSLGSGGWGGGGGGGGGGFGGFGGGSSGGGGASGGW